MNVIITTFNKTPNDLISFLYESKSKSSKAVIFVYFFSPYTDGKYFDVSSLTNLYNSKHIHCIYVNFVTNIYTCNLNN